MADPQTSAATIPDFGSLEDVADRMRRAERELRDMALGTIGDRARDRLAHKAEGVRLALSYVEEAIRATR